MRFITLSVCGSKPSAMAGSESVSRLMKSRCIGAKGAGRPAIELKSTAIIPARLPESRKSIDFLMLS